jgi:hypothetical protein
MKYLKNIRYILSSIAILAITGKICAQTPTNNKNFIMETVVKKKGITSTSQLSTLPVDSANNQIPALCRTGECRWYF